MASEVTRPEIPKQCPVCRSVWVTFASREPGWVCVECEHRWGREEFRGEDGPWRSN